MLLAPKPLAVRLLECVELHFGKSLKFFREPSGVPESSACFEIEHWTNPKTVALQIYIGSDSRPSGSNIVHELLHAKLATRGFPICVGTKAMNARIDRTGSAVYGTLANLVHHEIFFEEFLSFGFTKEQFVFDLAQASDPNEVRKTAEQYLADPEVASLAGGAWDIYCFAEWLSDRRGWSNNLSGALRVGRELFQSTIDANFEWVTKWFGRGEFRNHAQFPEAINSLMDKVGLPLAKFARVQACRSGDRAVLEDIP
jgi:hypothetical protein